jgi:MinD superfamily P-loop ATPase
MKIAVASGKGGTGKTTVSVNLALVAPSPVRLLDCDVEEPNCHLFLDPQIEQAESVTIPVPQVDTARCSACDECGLFCEFNAIVSFGAEPLLFPELCHGCGGCMKVCPEGAIGETEREIGVVERGHCRGLDLVQGTLNVAEPLAPPLVRAVKRHVGTEGITIVDSPAGTSCTMIESVRDCDKVVLVTEPTPFGLRDLVLAVSSIRELGIPCGVVVNRVGVGDGRVHEYCHAEGIPILLEIADDRRIAEAYSRGQTIIDAIADSRPWFDRLFQRLANGFQDA